MTNLIVENQKFPNIDEPLAHAVGGAALGHDEQPHDYVHVSGDFSEAPITRETALTDITERWRIQREAIIALPSLEVGLNLERIDRFCERYGIEQKPVCILSSEDFDKAIGIAEVLQGNEDGMYLPRLDIVIVRRDQDKEALNGVEYTESVIVHEQAHATTRAISIEVQAKPTPAIVRHRIPMALIPNDERTGFTVSTPDGEKRGTFLEEGLPELARGRYVVEELGKSEGFASEKQQYDQQVDAKYLYLAKRPTGEVMLDHYEGAIPAMILEKLISRSPNLETALWNARNSVRGLRELARYLDNIHPGLYNQIRKIDVETAHGQLQAAKLFERVSFEQTHSVQISENVLAA